jgi:hypothetical protein
VLTGAIARISKPSAIIVCVEAAIARSVRLAAIPVTAAAIIIPIEDRPREEKAPVVETVMGEEKAVIAEAVIEGVVTAPVTASPMTATAAPMADQNECARLGIAGQGRSAIFACAPCRPSKQR